jgi:hypothetical protein
MIPARPIVITLLLAASAGSARGGDQTITGLQACIDNARQADATCSKLTDDPAQRLDCFDRARNEQLACLQRALPDAAAKTTATEGDRHTRPREAAPKAATSDAPAQPAPQKSQQAKVPDHPTPQTGSQKNAPKNPPASSASSGVEPSTNSTTADAPADTASITANTKPAPQPSAAPAVQNTPPARQADALSEPKEPAKEAVKAPTKTDAPPDTASNKESTKRVPQAPTTQTFENPPPAHQAEAPSGPKEPAKDSAKASTKTDTPTEAASNKESTKPAPQPPATQTVENPPPHQAEAPSEPKEPAKDSAKASAKTGAPTEAASNKESTKPAPQPPATQTVENPAPARQAGAPSEPKEPANDSAKAATDAPAEAASSKESAKPAPTRTVESPPPAHQAGEPKEPAKDSAKAPAKTDAPTEAASNKESTKPPPQPPATQTVQSPAPARKADAVSEPKEPVKDAVKDSAKTPDTTATAKTVAAPAAKQPAPNWLVSEMPSPIDYRPLLTAVIHATSSSDGGPGSLTIRCIGGQTALSIHTEGTWRAQRKNALPVDHQINEQSAVRQMWILSADAKSATYSGDTISLLKSLPEGTRLTINVPDGANAKHDATFQLTGWDTVRKRIGTACKWPSADAQASSGRR